MPAFIGRAVRRRGLGLGHAGDDGDSHRYVAGRLSVKRSSPPRVRPEASSPPNGANSRSALRFEFEAGGANFPRLGERPAPALGFVPALPSEAHLP